VFRFEEDRIAGGKNMISNQVERVDMFWIAEVYWLGDKSLRITDNATIPLPALPPLRLSFRPDI
jgi:hypothetical protein